MFWALGWKKNFKIVSRGGGESSNSSFPHISKKTRRYATSEK
jgi:hypothetical protein